MLCICHIFVKNEPKWIFLFIVVVLLNRRIKYFFDNFWQDFGLAGLRCGVLHTWNQGLIQSLEYILYMCAVPVIIQDKLTTLLSDTGISKTLS